MSLPRVVALLGKTPSKNVSSRSASPPGFSSSSGSLCLQGQGSSGSVRLHQSLQGQGQADQSSTTPYLYQSPQLDEPTNKPSTRQGRGQYLQRRPSDTRRTSTSALFSMDSYREFEGLYEVTTPDEEEAPKRPC